MSTHVTPDAVGLLCTFMPGVLILAFVAYQSLKLARFQRGAFRLSAEVCWVVGGEDFAPHFKRGDRLEMVRDEEFRRRHMYGLWVLIRPDDGGDLLEIGLHTGKALNLKPGDTLEVLYNPEQPRHVVLPGENLWLGLGMLGAFGIFILLAPFIVGVPGLGG
ncbi:hypothetical protein ACQKGO_04865 [Corallococcus interemptor]|uniref:hypothetical protein n=1 Tax=Corallococcus interemptor TaxID=2316720 RepID=UPI003CFDCFDE